MLRRVDHRIAFGAAAVALPGLPEDVVATKILPYVAPRDEAIEAGDAEVVDLLALDSTCRAMRRLAAPRWRRKRRDVCRAVGARRLLRRRWRAIGGFSRAAGATGAGCGAPAARRTLAGWRCSVDDGCRWSSAYLC